MNNQIDLNCDLGEYDHLVDGNHDAAIMPFISSCNVACGQHAGNPAVIEQTVRLAFDNQVNVGAHPSYPDRANFGREVMAMSEVDLQSIFLEQISLVQETVNRLNGRLSHIKPHGALYNQAAQDKDLAMMLIETMINFDTNLMFYGLAHSATAWAAEQLGAQFVAEGFVDRGYTAERTLQPRTEPGALISNPEEMLQRALSMIEIGQIEAVNGASIALSIETLCIHGDHNNAVQTAKTLNHGLINAGIRLQAPKHQGS